MLRYLIGYILGTLFGFFLLAGIIQMSNIVEPFIFFGTVWVVGLVAGLVWSNRHHIKKRNDYYKKIRGSSWN